MFGIVKSFGKKATESLGQLKQNWNVWDCEIFWIATRAEWESFGLENLLDSNRELGGCKKHPIIGPRTTFLLTKNRRPSSLKQC